MNRSERRRLQTLEKKAAATLNPFDLAKQHHGAGRLPEAERLYQKVLQADPNQPDALHMLGVVSYQLGKSDIAIDLIKKAITLKPDYVEAYYNLDNVLKDRGKLDEAVGCYQKVTALNPDFADAHYNLGNVLKFLCRYEDAVASYQDALAIKPNSAEAHSNLGVVLQELGRLEEAVDHHRKAIAIDSKFAAAHNNLGNAFKDLGRTDDAADHYQKAVDISPNFADAHNNYGSLLQGLGRFEGAIARYDLANINSSRNRALECLFALRRYDDFFEKLDALIETDKNDIRAAALRTFASQQLNRENPHPFCKKPMDLVRVYERLVGADGVDGFLDGLVDELKSRASTWEPNGRATNKGFQSIPDLFVNPTGLLADLDKIIKDQIEIYRTEFASEDCDFIRLMPEKLSLSGWVVRLLTGGYQSEHIHPGGWLSGVFYLQVPEFRDQAEGAIEFGLWGYDYPILDKNYPRKRCHPKSGNIVLFPSSLFHRTIPFSSDEERMCVAFDLVPT
jgi:tetratricopeptide (TPR) repeat protein